MQQPSKKAKNYLGTLPKPKWQCKIHHLKIHFLLMRDLSSDRHVCLLEFSSNFTLTTTLVLKQTHHSSSFRIHWLYAARWFQPAGCTHGHVGFNVCPLSVILAASLPLKIGLWPLKGNELFSKYWNFG